MKSELFNGMRPAERRKFPCPLTLGVMGLAMAVAFTGCSPKVDANAQASSVSVSNVVLTAAQRQKFQLFTVARTQFNKTTDTSGTVDFDNDQSTSVLAPFGGPVSRLLVSLG